MFIRSCAGSRLLIYALTHARHPSNEAKQPRVRGLNARVDRSIPHAESSQLLTPYPSSISAHFKQQHAAQIERLTRRIRELEQGLDDVYSTISDEKHLLLRDENVLAAGPSTPGLRTGSPMYHDPSVYPADTINHFGMPVANIFCLARCDSSGTSRYAQHRPERRFMLLWGDR